MKGFILCILCFLFQQGFASKNDLTIHVPTEGFVGADISVWISYPANFELSIAPNETFQMIGLRESTSIIQQSNWDKDKTFYNRELRFRCLQGGRFEFPLITVFTSKDTLISESQIIYVRDIHERVPRDTSLAQQLVRIHKIQEFRELGDMQIQSRMNKSKVKINDTVAVRIQLFTRLENEIQLVHLYHLQQDHLLSHMTQQETKVEPQILDGKVYREVVSLIIRLIPKAAGFYSINNMLLAYNISFASQNAVPFMVPNTFLEKSITVPKIEFTAY